MNTEIKKQKESTKDEHFTPRVNGPTSRLSQTQQNLLRINKLCTEKLEEYIYARYEAAAPQQELDALETEYSKRISEEDLDITEEDPRMEEEIQLGASLEECLAQMYHRYLNLAERCGMKVEDILVNMRSALEVYSHNKLNAPTDDEILAAAKDVYERKKNLIAKYRSKNKLSNIFVKSKHGRVRLRGKIFLH